MGVTGANQLTERGEGGGGGGTEPPLVIVRRPCAQSLGYLGQMMSAVRSSFAYGSAGYCQTGSSYR
ncbi:hypothetical protein E2C01_039163 [Portunus trituberculatus]|uniref:Uncharacterized protein n=1 Tax=Portunus trituberculatus TaxID=210409 RepID=A0A5B7FM08_PORTR|nr:hypothetical protein [Portunus trituberculatus]